jgi:cytochrome P450
MRVFPIVVPISRVVTENQDQELAVGSSKLGNSQKHVLPKGCGVIVNNTGIHYNTRNWVRPEILDPRRWLSSCPNTFDPTAAVTEDLDENTHSIPNHAKGTFMSFGEGPRACLGKRFSQVEFISIFSTLLREYRVVLGGTKPAHEVERTLRLRSGGSPVTLTTPEDVQLRLEKRW